MNINSRVSLTLAALAFVTAGPVVQAVTIDLATYPGTLPTSFSSNFQTQDMVLEDTFNLATTGNLTIYTTSYSSGGFQPNLTLYRGTGQYVATAMSPGTSPIAVPDPATNNSFDGYLTASALTPGSYILTLSDWEVNQPTTATNLSDGFINYGDGLAFVDAMGNTRTGDYALSIEATPTPEPATLWLTAGMLAGLGLVARKRSTSRTN